MASEYETVAKVIEDFAYLITLGNIRPAVATNIKSRIEAAHKRKVAELREFLVRRSSHLNAILQKALELRNDVPSELRKVMDECIVAEDKAIGFGVFSEKGAEDEDK